MARAILSVLFLVVIHVNANAADELPFTSSFESADFSEWDGGNDSSLAVTNEDASDGQYSARARHQLGLSNDNWKDHYFGDHPRVNGVPADDELWLSFDSKFDTNFSFGNDQNLQKIAIVNFEDTNWRRRYQLIINIAVPNESYVIENLSWNEDRSFDKTVNYYTQNIGATSATMRRGQWDNIKLYSKLNTPGQRNGILRLWVNGVMTIEVTDAYQREETSFNPNKLILSNYTGSRTDISGYQWWDNFYIGESAPVATTQFPPSPPILLQQ
ncbi:MAG: heparin lyase I family protein [Candidatus Thiodiazotropha sp.]